MPIAYRIGFWALFCLVDGIADAFMYHLKDHNKNVKPNEHYILSFRRLIIGAGILLELDKYVLPTSVTCIMFQPFFHNNAYYITRHLLNRNVYGVSLLCQSESSTALLTKYLNPHVRIILATFATYFSVILSCLYSM